MKIFTLNLLLVLQSFVAMSQMIDDDQPVIICPVHTNHSDIPQFNNEECITTTARNIDPQYQHIWVKTQLHISPELIEQPQPIGLYIMGKTSSIAYVNGQLVGSNGNPASSLESEIAGNIDTVFYLDKQLLKKDDNQLVIRMSAQQGLLHLSHPISSIYVNTYNNPRHVLLNHYWFSLLSFGAFVLAALYLGVLSIIQKNKKSIVFLSLMSFFIACQLLVETTRGTVSYLYAYQDIRLLLIVLCSYAFGLCLFAHIVYLFVDKHHKKIISLMMAIALITVIIIDGFDLKAATAIILPATFALVLCLYFVFKKKEYALPFSLALMVFIVLFIISPSLFLDRYFYYVVASLLMFLFIQQAIDLSNQRKIHEKEKVRADRLQLIIDQNNEKTNPAHLKIKGAGQLTMIAIEDIAFCKGAGDYVEIFKTDEKSILYNGSLKELETMLPVIFLKVHRSYIVNTSKIISLNRSPMGTGELSLDNGSSVPVSRRIMPKVRESLG